MGLTRALGAGLVCAFCLCAGARWTVAETLRVATYNVDLGREGPGLLLRDLTRKEDPKALAAAQVIAKTAPDILALQGIDYDFENRALEAFADLIAKAGQAYPYRFALKPNRGLATGLDLNGDGRLGGAEDAQGFGAFAGAGGMAILSRHPILVDQVQDFSPLLWRNMPGALLPQIDGAPFPSAEAQAVQRLSSSGHWVVPIRLPDQSTLTLLTFDATPPVFDGPEDRNGRRNHDEIVFWRLFLDGQFGPPPRIRFALLGDANLDPEDGQGWRAAIRGLLSDPRLQDPHPQSQGAPAAANPDHIGDPSLDTVDWRDPAPGNLRVSYVLPSADWQVAQSAVFWPPPGSADADLAATASAHRLVWVDLVLPPEEHPN